MLGLTFDRVRSFFAATDVVDRGTSAGSGIDAAEGSDRRRRHGRRVRSPDKRLDKQKRDGLTVSATHAIENFSIAAWAMRRHLDYVTRFNFQARSGDKGLDRAIEDFVKAWSRKLNCDVAGRHSLKRMIRLVETRRIIDGDAFLVRMSSGHLQGIEGDRIRTPDDVKKEEEGKTWFNGIQCSPGGRARRYGVHRRTSNGNYELERKVPARNVYSVGYFTGFDQKRGVSPLTSALNSFQSIYESFDKALAKIGLIQALTLVTYEDLSEDDPDDADDNNSTPPEVSFGEGPSHLQLDRDDKAEILESNSPAPNTADFWQAITGVGLKALDIPMSFADESFTNFFGAKAAWQHYARSAKAKQEDLHDDILLPMSIWRLAIAFDSGELLIPSGRTIGSLGLDWIPEGVPWWRPLEDVTAEVMAIDNKLKSRRQVRRETHGDDWFDVVQQLAEEEQFMRELNIQDDKDVKGKLDAYGVGVRAGTITPQIDDEQTVREMLGLSPMSDEVDRDWQATRGVRTPTTIQTEEPTEGIEE